MKIAVTTLALMLATWTTAQGQGASSAPGGLLVSTSELAGLLKDPNVVILQVDATFAEAHIPGARFLKYGDFAVDGADGLGSELPPADQIKRVFESVGVSDGSRVIIYGASPVAAARAFFTLDAAGHTRVALLDGGLRAWQAEGRPVETGSAAALSKQGTFTPKMSAAKIADAKSIQLAMSPAAGPYITLIDVRPDPEYLGTDGGMGGAHAAGHINGAKQLTWNSLVGADGRFLPRDQLQAKLQAAGAQPNRTIVSYCMVGMRASVVYFVARHLGYDARLYDGSIVDWSQRKLAVTTIRQ